jgi:hypothetical protein
MLALRESLEGKYCLRVIDVERDGNCLFRSIETFLNLRSVPITTPTPSAGAGGAAVETTWNHLALRSTTVDFIRSFRSHFAQFLPPGGDDAYLAHMARAGTWGGEPEIVALANILQRSIEVYVRNPTTNHASHERTYVPFTPFATLNDVAPIRLLYFNGVGGPVPNHYALLVPCNASNVQLRDMVMQARTHAFERIVISSAASPAASAECGVHKNLTPSPTDSFEKESTCQNPDNLFGGNDGDGDDGIDFGDLSNYDFEAPSMPFPVPAAAEPAAPAAAEPAAPEHVVVDDSSVEVEVEVEVQVEEVPRAKKTKRGRSYYIAFEDNMSHGHERIEADVMAKAEVACRTCGCPKCAAVSNHENAFEMFIQKPTSPVTTCQLYKIWTTYWQVKRRR